MIWAGAATVAFVGLILGLVGGTVYTIRTLPRHLSDLNEDEWNNLMAQVREQRKLRHGRS